MARQSWLDEAGEEVLIDDMAQQLGTFVDALADGRIDDAELKAQEDRLITLMKEVEPELDDALHAKITRLLCETSAFNVMQMLNQVQKARPVTRFQG